MPTSVVTPILVLIQTHKHTHTHHQTPNVSSLGLQVQTEDRAHHQEV